MKKEQSIVVYVVIRGEEPIVAEFKTEKDADAFENEVREKLAKTGQQFATGVHYKN